MTEQFYIGQTFETEYPPEAAEWCNKNNATIEALEESGFKIIEIPIHTPTEEEIKLEKIQKLQQYLDETDWYVVRYAETGIEIPEEVKQKRQEAREEISNLRGDTQNETISEENSTNSYTEATDLMV